MFINVSIIERLGLRLVRNVGEGRKRNEKAIEEDGAHKYSYVKQESRMELKRDGTPYKTTAEQRRKALAYYYKHHAERKLKMLKYFHSDKGKVAYERYKHSEKGKQTRRVSQRRRYWKNPESYRAKGRKHDFPACYNRRVKITLDVLICVEKDNGKYHAWCPSLKGLHTEGYCLVNGIANAKIAAEAYILSCLKHGDPIQIKDT